MKTTDLTIRAAFGVAFLLMFGIGSAPAAMVFGAGEEVLLSELEEPDASIVIHGQEFSNFQYTAGVDAPGSDTIVVEGVLNADDSVTLVFNVAFSAGVLSPDLIDGSLRFTASILDENAVFDTAELTGTLEVPTTGDNSGVASIGETIVASPGNVGFGLIVENNVLDGVQGPESVFDSVSFSPADGFTQLDVTKDILVQAGSDPFDRARLTTFTQTFSKQVIVPEPGTGVLALLAGVACWSRRR